jgi:hypothetical protein
MRLPRVLLLILSSTLLFSCIRLPPPQHFYRPGPVEPVLLEHKEQLLGNIIGYNEMSRLSLSYSPANKLGLQLGIGSWQKRNEYYNNPFISAGYYSRFAHIFLAEVYGGIGTYAYKNTDYSLSIMKINYFNFFLQPSVAFMGKNIEAAFTVRFDYLRRSRTSIIAAYDASEWKYGFLKYRDYSFIQPGITIKGGWKKVKLQLQVSKSFPLNNRYNSIYGPDDEAYYSSGGNTTQLDNYYHLAGGITVDLNVKLFKKKK